jgi:hypothetical protein
METDIENSKNNEAQPVLRFVRDALCSTGATAQPARGHGKGGERRPRCHNPCAFPILDAVEQ